MNGTITGIIAAVAAVFASSGLWQYVLYKAQQRDKKKSTATKGDIEALQAQMVTKAEHAELCEKIEKVEEASLSTLHTNLYRLTRRVFQRGSITAEEIDELENIYKPYHALGGNSTGTDYYQRAKALPLSKEGLK